MTASDAGRVWVETNRSVIELAFTEFMRTGDWPKVTELRRHFARLGSDIDVAQVAKDKPGLPGVLRPMHIETLVLQIRHLRYIPQAEPLLYVCVAVIRRAVDVYLEDVAEPTVSSTDPGVAAQAGGDTTLLMRAGKLMRDEPGGPLAGGSYGEDHWQSPVNEHSVLDFRGVYSPEGFVERQDAILDRSFASSPGGQVSAAQPELTPRRAFVLMPFGPDWSRPVYDLIQRTVVGLNISPAPIVERADDITRPGRITDQIVMGIGEADVVIADITGVNPNVMWELGFAHALGKPVVILNQDIAASPFDLHDYRQVPYNLNPTDEQLAHLAAMLHTAFDQ